MSDDLRRRIHAFLVEQIRLLLDGDAPDALPLKTDLRVDLAVDSLSYMALFFQAGDAFEVDLAVIPPERFSEIHTLGDMVEVLVAFSALSPPSSS